MQLDCRINVLKDAWKEVYDLAEKELQCLVDGIPGTERINPADAIRNWKEASYYLALCYYWMEDYAEAIKLACVLEEKRAQVLYGACMLQIAETKSEVEKAYEYCAELIKDAEYAAASKCALEEKVYILLSLQL